MNKHHENINQKWKIHKNFQKLYFLKAPFVAEQTDTIYRIDPHLILTKGWRHPKAKLFKIRKTYGKQGLNKNDNIHKNEVQDNRWSDKYWQVNK